MRSARAGAGTARSLRGEGVLALLDDVNWDPDGLVPMILQDAGSKDVLMVAWVNREALSKTIETREAHFWSRSRRRLWKKGERSGNVQRVTELLFDCDMDTVVAMVEPAGPACHAGYGSCFYRRLEPLSLDGALVTRLDREFDPCEVYGDQASAGGARGKGRRG